MTDTPQLTPQQEAGQQQIKHEKEAIDEEIQAADAAHALALTKLRNLQNRCRHPRAYKTVIGGENAKYCPDCKWQR